VRVRLVTSLCAFAFLMSQGAVASGGRGAHAEIVQRFLTIDDGAPRQVRALRRFEARNDKLDKSAWMEVWTEADETGFRYDIVGQGGSGYIIKKVFLEALEAEQTMWQDGASARAAISTDNYRFTECAPDAVRAFDVGRTLSAPAVDVGRTLSGPPLDRHLTCVTLEPRRKEVLLVSGSMFLDPATGDLVRVVGSLSKTPSFWTRRVEISRQYERVGGVRVPVAVESTASLRLAGLSTMSITYRYESVNGQRVGSP
jgi:hypothetical protein